MDSSCSYRFWVEEGKAEDYDSTWEGEEEEEEEEGEEEEDGGGGEAEAAAGEEPEDAGEQPGSVKERDCREQSSNSSRLYQVSWRRNWTAAKDLQRYRHHYPGLKESENEDEEEMWNFSFYKNEVSFKPQGVPIEDLLSHWWDDYEILEDNHSYIQWLFPLREHGMNWLAKPLTSQEIEAFKRSEEVMERFVRAYELMLRFYGIVLVNKKTGELKRAKNWADRFDNLNRFSHNNLRITRILKCLGEMGYERYQVHLVKFFLTETLVKGTLPNVKKSALDYFLFTVRSKRRRRELVHYAWQHFKPQEDFVWGPKEKLQKYRPRPAKPQLHQKAEGRQETPGKKCGDSEGKDQNQPPETEQKAGDAAKLQPEASDEDGKEKVSKCALEGGDDEEEKEASSAQLEEKDLNSEAEEVQGTPESDCTKESKKRKLDANMADAKKVGPLKSSTDIENISHNLGECAINAEIPSSGPPSQAEEDQEALKEDDASTKHSAAPETIDAAVKRRKVDKRTSKPSACGAEENPSAAKPEAEKENVSEKNATVEVRSEKGGGGDADGEAVRPLAGSRLPRTGSAYPRIDACDLSGDQGTVGIDQHHCNSTLLGGKSEADGVEQQKKAENADEKGQTEPTDKKQAPESLEQSTTPTCPEEDGAEVATQKAESSEHAAEPGGEQGAAEPGGEQGAAEPGGEQGAAE
ncbi:opioid growth factor receptor isoform X2 [Myiozetetes cayanensis]|uniref:opioid growth factor receptor isoform X2 n=1 Tax=Myiozetetes cayanensis TaxID=478635 RepID=UPI00215FDE52|nr:opioid growth factor receptor isoform X2 [Myiozetetes cayanensis]